MDVSASVAGWIAIGAAAAAAVSLLFAFGYYLALRRVRRAQHVLLGRAGRISSTSRCRCRAGSTTCTEP